MSSLAQSPCLVDLETPRDSPMNGVAGRCDAYPPPTLNSVGLGFHGCSGEETLVIPFVQDASKIDA